jgi:hypothetical protein
LVFHSASFQADIYKISAQQQAVNVSGDFTNSMIQRLIKVFIFLITTHTGISQVVDRAPSGRQNYLAVEGGGIYVSVDTSTPLDTLLSRLSNNWEFVETGKMYWIGYTEDMFSVAARGEAAIEPLVRLAEKSSNENAKVGAIYCLHLIGIDRTIAGRFTEKFVNLKARMALLQVLKKPDLRETVMRLLIRDPWLSDIPYIIKAIETCNADCWALVNGLIRYNVKGLPIHSPIPENIQNISIRLKYSDPLVLEANFDFNAQIKEALDSFKKLRNHFLVIEDTLFKSKLTGDIISKFDNSIDISDFFRLLDFDNYTSLGSRVQYYMENDVLHICSPETAKKRLLDWWTNQTPEQKATYQNHR